MIQNQTQINIIKDNLYHNLDYLKKSKNKDILPVVKANAYGHGLYEIVSLLYDYGIRNFAVARYTEYEMIHDFNLKDIKVLEIFLL